MTDAKLDFLGSRLKSVELVLVQLELGDVKKNGLRVHLTLATLKHEYHSLRYGWVTVVCLLCAFLSER